jgi:hypothetical protein
MVLEPSRKLYARLTATAALLPSYDKTDQGERLIRTHEKDQGYDGYELDFAAFSRVFQKV